MTKQRLANAKHIAQAIFCGSLLLFVTGCSSFNREWNKVAKSNPPTQGIAGLWEGSWLSDANGHSGRLRCIVTQQGTNRYVAKFKANYKIVLSFSYTVALEGEQNGILCLISGREDLVSLAGGVYEYSGKVSETNFFATYSSRYDHGVFQMRRPCAVAATR